MARDAKEPSSDGDGAPLIAHSLRADGFDASEDGTGRGTPLVPVGITIHGQGMQVRRLTPEECEALQGFPRGYTKISDKTADGPRYRALGNSMAVPCMAWIGKRIQMVEEIA
jgi:DNA (cytosine-5)-methyltransferase 1